MTRYNRWELFLLFSTTLLTAIAVALFYTLPSNLMRLDLVYGAF